MVNWWPAIVFGWPAVIVALILSAAGIVRKKPTLLFVAAVILIPITIYLIGSPRIGWVGLAIPLLLSGAGIAVRRRRQGLAWVLLAPVVGAFVWLAIIVMGE